MARGLLYECIPIRIKDVARLMRWISPNAFSLFRIFVNLVVVALRLALAFLRKYYIHAAGFWLGLWASNSFGLGKLYLTLCVIAAVFLNLGRQKRQPGELSAYSIFNPDHRRLFGELTMDMLDRQFRNAPEPGPAIDPDREN